MYNFDNENKKLIEKKVESLFRHIKKYLKDLSKHKFAPIFSAFNINSGQKGLIKQKSAPISLSFHIKSDLKDLIE